jgi:hypothetical protein
MLWRRVRKMTPERARTAGELRCGAISLSLAVRVTDCVLPLMSRWRTEPPCARRRNRSRRAPNRHGAGGTGRVRREMPGVDQGRAHRAGAGEHGAALTVTAELVDRALLTISVPALAVAAPSSCCWREYG